jgi:hypothetical protein
VLASMRTTTAPPPRPPPLPPPSPPPSHVEEEEEAQPITNQYVPPPVVRPPPPLPPPKKVPPPTGSRPPPPPPPPPGNPSRVSISSSPEDLDFFLAAAVGSALLGSSPIAGPFFPGSSNDDLFQHVEHDEEDETSVVDSSEFSKIEVDDVPWRGSVMYDGQPTSNLFEPEEDHVSGGGIFGACDDDDDDVDLFNFK